MRIVSFNVLSNRSSRFVLAGRRNETVEEFEMRYALIIKELAKYMKQNVDLICLQEVTFEFTHLLIAYMREVRFPYWFIYDHRRYQQGCLINSSKYRYQMISHQLFHINPHHKIQLLQISGRDFGMRDNFYLANVHFSGDITEEGTKGRHLIISKIVEIFEERYGNLPMIIVGDFNDELKYLCTDKFKKYLKNKNLRIYDQNKKITSYHKYDYKFDETEKTLIFQGVTDNPYQTLDHIIYTNSGRYSFKLNNFKIEPPTGLRDMQVPYKHRKIKGEIVNEPNYDVWPSDHALMVYELLYNK